MVAAFMASGLMLFPAEAKDAKATPVAKPVNKPVRPVASGPDIADVACKSFSPVSLTASAVHKGDFAYMEFRSRMSPAIPSGHMYVVFGRLDDKGKPVNSHIMGLYPKGSVLGLYGGSVVWVPANVKGHSSECSGLGTLDAWRVPISQSQYEQVLARARSILAKPPQWNMFGYNCNHFVADFGSIAGLKRPANKNLPSFAYLPAYIKANPDRKK